MATIIGVVGNPIIGLFFILAIILIAIIFIFLVFILSERSKTGYNIIEITHTWIMEDSGGVTGNGRKKYNIKLTKPLKSIRDIIQNSETLVNFNGREVILASEVMDGGQKVVLVNFDALYPRNFQFEFELHTYRHIQNGGQEQYLEMPIRCRTDKAILQVTIPELNANDEMKPSPIIFQRKAGATVQLEKNKKSIIRRKLLNKVSDDYIPPWRLVWVNENTEVDSDYILKWEWISR